MPSAPNCPLMDQAESDISGPFQKSVCSPGLGLTLFPVSCCLWLCPASVWGSCKYSLVLCVPEPHVTVAFFLNDHFILL